MPNAGENAPGVVRDAVLRFLGKGRETAVRPPESAPELPARPPVLCAGCPHRASFYAVKEAAGGRKAVFSGDIGCYTLGNAMPLDMVDTCLCMGAGVTMAQGLHRVEPDTVNFAFIGDSTFFHTGIPGVLNAVYNHADVIVSVLDNYTTAMTGGQPHPGTGRTAMGGATRKTDICGLLSALGADDVQRVNAFDLSASRAAVERAMPLSGVRAIVFEGECAALARGKKGVRSVDGDNCAGCALCVKKLGCPALTMKGDNAYIDGTACAGCGVCGQLCKFGAIGG